MKKILTVLLVLVSSFFSSSFTFAAGTSKPLALVYRGKGACGTCAIGAAIAARKAGYQVKWVNHHFRDFEIFNQAKLWVQPGGTSKTASQYMGPVYLAHIRDFVANGGGYVGFCAGGFLSTLKVGNSDQEGLGIIPGTTQAWDLTDKARVTQVQWEGKSRYLYFHGGPYFDLSGVSDPNLKVVATYADGKVAAIETKFGKGKVFVTGAHPEELGFMKALHLVKDPDGSDRFIAVKMMQEVLH